MRLTGNYLIAADKPTNFYRLGTSSNNKLLESNVTKTYKKAAGNTLDNIISEEKKVAEALRQDDRIEALAEKDCFVTLKDHKPNFNRNRDYKQANPPENQRENRGNNRF